MSSISAAGLAFLIKIKNAGLVLRSIYINKTSKANTFYILEKADWVISDIGKNLKKNIDSFDLTFSAIGLRNKTLHYGSFHVMFSAAGLRLPHSSNRVIVSVNHLVPGDKKNERIRDAVPYVEKWHIICNSTRKDLISFGVDPEKIVLLHFGMDLDSYTPKTDKRKRQMRKELGISDKQIAVGSFQKDGNGWGEGLVPKLVKGPDVFCDVIERLDADNNIFVVLTGPARGYVKKRLDKIGVPYSHAFLKNPGEVSRYYDALDYYLISARTEGGPKAVLESWASATPLITTQVGMAIDVVQHGINGMICEVEDVGCLEASIRELILDDKKRLAVVNASLEQVKNFSWKEVADKHEQRLYNTKQDEN